MRRVTRSGVAVALTVVAVSVLMPSKAQAAEPPLAPRTLSIQGEVLTYYKYALNRAPDVAGFEFHVVAAASQCYPSFGNVPVGIWTSPEFTRRGLTAAQRVQSLYRGLLARTGASSEINYWVSKLHAGHTWTYVVLGFARSAEYYKRIQQVCNVHAHPALFITEADQLLHIPFGLWLRNRELRMRVAGPYNWTTDGCSVIPDGSLMFDYRVCWRHDWGYRNFGRGLRLDRNEARRRIIDDVLHGDMTQSCSHSYSNPDKLLLCFAQADTVYKAVRAGGSVAFY